MRSYFLSICLTSLFAFTQFFWANAMQLSVEKQIMDIKTLDEAYQVLENITKPARYLNKGLYTVTNIYTKEKIDVLLERGWYEIDRNDGLNGIASKKLGDDYMAGPDFSGEINDICYQLACSNRIAYQLEYEELFFALKQHIDKLGGSMNGFEKFIGLKK